MNERIRQLAEQAGISLSQKDFSYYWVESAEDMEKFAKLIVRECVDIAHTNANVDETYDYACHTIAWKIKQHFGVEE